MRYGTSEVIAKAIRSDDNLKNVRAKIVWQSNSKTATIYLNKNCR